MNGWTRAPAGAVSASAAASSVASATSATDTRRRRPDVSLMTDCSGFTIAGNGPAKATAWRPE